MYHYTKYLGDILTSGQIRTEDLTTPATAANGLMPGVWLTSRETFEPTCLPAIVCGTHKRLATFEEVVRAKDVGRLVVPDDYPGLLTWQQWRQLHQGNGMHLAVIAAMARYAKKLGSDTWKYRWSRHSIPLAACTKVQRWVDGEWQ
jgi:hypothetical protein